MWIEDETSLEPEAGSSKNETVGVWTKVVSFSCLYLVHSLFLAVALRREELPWTPPPLKNKKSLKIVNKKNRISMYA